MGPASEQAVLERIFVAEDGSIKALYTDNSLLLLSGNAASFTRVSTTGAKTVQLTDCCLSRYKPLLAELLAFRNQSLDVPYFPAWLQKQLHEDHGLLFSTGYPVTDTTWPTTAEAAVEDGLVELLDEQTIQLFTTCGSAYVTLQHTAIRFAVCYPLLVNFDAPTNTYTYIQHTQVFSRSQYPIRWQHVLAVAVAAADLAAHSDAQHAQQQLPQTQQQLRQLHAQLQEPQLLLLGVTNKLGRTSMSHSPARQSYSAAGGCTSAPAGNASISSSPKRYGSPVQRQHRPWKDDQAPFRTHQHYQQQQQQQQQQDAHLLAQSGDFSVSFRHHSPDLSCNTSPGQQHVPQLASDGAASPTKQWHPPGTPGSLSAALYAVAVLQQEQQELGALQHMPAASAASPAAARQVSSLDCVVQLPINSTTLQTLPSSGRLQLQPQEACATSSLDRVPRGAHGSSAQALPGASSSSGWSSHIAAALAEALWQRQQGVSSSSSSSGSSSGVGSWWLEPHLLLPRDELLTMVWSPEATFIFMQEAGEVETWLHADDSCLFSFQAGAFLTHLQPHAAATAARGRGSSTGQAAAAAAAAGDWRSPHSPNFGKTAQAGPAAQSSSTALLARCAAELSGQEGLVDGCVDASEVSRVYPASTLPGDLLVPGLGQDGARSGVMLPLGRIATEALRFRSTMVCVQASLARAASAGGTAAAVAASNPPSSSTNRWHQPRLTERLAAGSPPQHHHHQQQQQQQQQQQRQQQVQGGLSLKVREEQDVPDVGRFTAYADGRVRVLFADRTILSLDGARVQAKLILPDGSRQEVPVSRPLGVEEYVQAALEFATWSSHTPLERAVQLRMQALVAAELRSAARMAAICEWGSNPARLPAAAYEKPLLESPDAPLLLTEGPEHTAGNLSQPLWLAPSSAAENGAGSYGHLGCYTQQGSSNHPKDCVEDMLEANRRLLERL